MKALEIEGKKFSRLTAIRRVTGKMWLFRCDCGNEIERIGTSVTSGNTKSCGCLRKEATAARNASHGLTTHPLYFRWAGMIQRCVNPNHVGYKNYGAKGVKVCERWMNFESFLSDMGMPKTGESIDRIDSNGDYEPTNCRWASSKEQSRNTKRNVVVEVDGVSLTVRDWEIKLGFGRGAIQRRIDLGWPHKSAVTEPIRPGKHLERRAI